MLTRLMVMGPWTLLVVTALLPLAGCGGTAVTEGTDRPVIITRVSNEDIPYPVAQVHGALSMRNGCLMIDDAVAFWPAGTGWDAGAQAVTFAGDFEGSSPAAVGTAFRGGGGVWSIEDDLGAVLSPNNVERLLACAEKTRSDQFVLAYPASA